MLTKYDVAMGHAPELRPDATGQEPGRVAPAPAPFLDSRVPIP
jgi:hypothetical protein